MRAWFFGLMAAVMAMAAIMSNSSSTPTPAVPAQPQRSSLPQGDDGAKLIVHCGKPNKDFTKNEGGQRIRHIVYKKQNVELDVFVARCPCMGTGLHL